MKHKFILIVLLCLGGLASGSAFFFTIFQKEVSGIQCQNQWVSKNLTLTDIEAQAKLITVKIYSKNSGGSGVIIARKNIQNQPNYIYTIITNQHVISNDKSFPHRIKMPDGKIYKAELVKNISFGEKDLALLQVYSRKQYNTAIIAPKAVVNSPQDIVYAAGFPYDKEEITTNKGNITQIFAKSFEKGYEIGSTNDIQKGMSGGPVLNQRGELIGINGIFAHPLFNKKYIFDDGTIPTNQEQEKMTESSWSIPIQTAVSLAPDLFPPGVVRETNAIARQSTIFIDDLQGNNDGSGVIISRQNNTYTVLTASHVFTSKRSDKYINQKDPYQSSLPTSNYQILTPDGQCHLIKPKTIKLLDQAANLDLAVFQFQSKQNYSVPKLAQYELADAENQWIFVSGWHTTKTGGIERPLNPGYLFSQNQGKYLVRNSESQSQGYELVYTNKSEGGMSGGPVLDTQGRVIGIHGRSDGTNDRGKVVFLGYSLGIPIGKFLSVAQQLDINPKSLQIENNKPEQTTETENQEIVSHFAFSTPSKRDDAIKWLNYGNELWRFFAYKEAIAAYNIAISKKPDYALAYYARGLAQRDQGYFTNDRQFYRGALESFDNAIKHQNNFYEAWREKAQMHLIYQAYDKALISINKAIDLNSQDINLYAIKSNILLLQENYREAKNALDTAIKLARDTQPSLYSDRGNILALMKDFGMAEKDFNRAIELNSQSPDAYIARAYFRNNYLENIKSAEEDFTQAIKINPNYAQAYYQRGKLRLNWGNYQGAIEDYNQVIRITPYDPSAYYQRASAYRWLGNTTEAIADFSKTAELFKNRGNANYYKQAIIRVRQLQKRTNQLALFEGKAFNTTVRKGSNILIEILELNTQKQFIKIRIAFYKGLYGEGELTGTIDKNNQVNVSGEAFSFEAGGTFNAKFSFKIVSNQLINGNYQLNPEIGTQNFLQNGELSDMYQIKGTELKLNSNSQK